MSKRCVYDSLFHTLINKDQREKKKRESSVMASASSSSSSAILSISYHFRSQKPIFSSKAFSSVSTALNGRRAFGSIEAAQKTSLGSPRRRTQNVEGDIFVDNTCIDCDTCRWMVPVRFFLLRNL